MHAPTHTSPLLKHSHSTRERELSESTEHPPTILVCTLGPLAATFTLSRNCDTETTFPGGVSHSGDSLVCISFPKFFIRSSFSLRAHKLCRSAHYALNDPPMGMVPALLPVEPAHHTLLYSVRENWTICTNP